MRITKLIPVLREIRKFAELAPKEIIILDFHRFPYPSKFTTSMHDRLVSIISQELEHLAVPSPGIQSGQGPTLNDVWAHNKSIIICYANRETSRGIKFS